MANKQNDRLLTFYNLILAICKDKYAVPEMMAERITKEVDEVVAESVKARDKEWVEWLEERKSPAVTAGGYRKFTVDDEEWQALKRGKE